MVETSSSLNASNGFRTGESLRSPVCVNLGTYAVEVEDGRVFAEVQISCWVQPIAEWLTASMGSKLSFEPFG